jgi:hypothetical protein
VSSIALLCEANACYLGSYELDKRCAVQVTAILTQEHLSALLDADAFKQALQPLRYMLRQDGRYTHTLLSFAMAQACL